MKPWIISFALSICFMEWCQAQVVFDLPDHEKRVNHSKVFASFQASLGVINPVGVNNYIQNEISKLTQGNAIIYQGSTSISVAGSLNFALLYRFKNRIQVATLMEYAGAPKTIIIDRTTLQYNMNRFSVGGMGSYLVPREDNHAFYCGFGLLYHMMWFENFKANTPGPRFEIGYSSFGQKNDFELFLNFDLAKGHTNQSSNSLSTIDFSGAYLGSRIVF